MGLEPAGFKEMGEWLDTMSRDSEITVTNGDMTEMEILRQGGEHYYLPAYRWEVQVRKLPTKATPYGSVQDIDVTILGKGTTLLDAVASAYNQYLRLS